MDNEEEKWQHIDKLEQRIRFRYINTRFKLSKQHLDTPNTTRYNVPFRKVAEWCYDNNADFEKYVDAQFILSDPCKMQAQFLVGPIAEKKYKNLAAQTFISPEASYNVQINYLRNQLYLAKRAVENILMDDDIKFNPWFRILITKEPIDDIVFKYKDAAREELKNKNLVQFLKTKQLDLTRISNEYAKE